MNVPLQASMTVTDGLSATKSRLLIFHLLSLHILNKKSWFYFTEPGYYEDGNFGIRLENVLVVNDAETEFNFGDKGYLQFEHITWVLLICSLSLN